MLIDISFLNSDLIVSAVLAFLVGVAGMMVYTKFRNADTKRAYQADEAVVEAVVLEYTRRLRDYDKVIAELRTRLDIMEVRSQSYVASQSQSRQPQPHVASVSEPTA